MKKLFTLIMLSLVCFDAAQAQTVKITKTDGSVVTMATSEVKSIEILPAESLAGTYTGTDTLNFTMGQAYKTTAENVQFVVEMNSDSTLNVTIPEETFDFSAIVPMVGKIVQGTYTIKNIPYDTTKKAYYLDYTNNATANVTVFGKAKDYTVTKGIVTVTFSGSTVTIENEHKFGNMPMELYATFVGTK